jgi:hypothetical protein
MEKKLYQTVYAIEQLHDRIIHDFHPDFELAKYGSLKLEHKLFMVVVVVVKIPKFGREFAEVIPYDLAQLLGCF